MKATPARTHLDRLSHSRGSSPGWTRRLGRSSRSHRSGQTSILCWCTRRSGRCSTDPHPDRPTDTARRGRETPRDTPKRQSCCSSTPSSWSTTHMDFRWLTATVLTNPCQRFLTRGLALEKTPVVVFSQVRSVCDHQELLKLVGELEVIHVSTLHLLKEQFTTVGELKRTPTNLSSLWLWNTSYAIIRLGLTWILINAILYFIVTSFYS